MHRCLKIPAPPRSCALLRRRQRGDGAGRGRRPFAESNFNPFAVSPAGAVGIAQFMPGTAASYGLEDPFDPAEAIGAQARLMSDLMNQFLEQQRAQR
ncbi:MAG: lytic transglycosylase domain-containing protein, partial [Actinobacteria bacterium]|nr:lytic transglycosylase domain-containing protein [Actinomycetota bacterium]